MINMVEIDRIVSEVNELDEKEKIIFFQKMEEVIITFTKPVEKDQEKILQFFGTWDDEDVDCITEIIKERDYFYGIKINLL